MKKFFITIIAMLLPLLASATYIKGINYNLNSSTQTATVSNCSNSGNVIIPSYVTYNGVIYTVTKIGSQSFRECNATSLTIPNTVTSIDITAFWGSSLTSVTIPSSVTYIGEEAFKCCDDISIYITDLEAWCKIFIHPAAFMDPSDGEQYYHRLFLNGNEIKNLVIPSSVTSINTLAFSNCTSFTSVTIPNTVTSIGNSAFKDCHNLTSVVIPSSVTSIGSSAFVNCNGLTSIAVEDGNLYYDSRNNCNAIIEKSSNTLLVGCKRTIIPNSVTSIGSSAFSSCSGLTSIVIPNSVTSIGSSAFSGCTSLTSVNIPASVQTIRDGAFSECTSLTSITIPNSVTTIGGSAFSRCSGLTSITIPNSVTSIGYSAFYGTGWYNNQPDGLVYAGKIAYRYKGAMPNNTSITIKDGTLGIAESAFSYCSGLTSITIPNSVTSIGSSAFSGCSGLTYIEIPNSVTSIGYSAFYGTGWYNNQPDGLVYAGNVAYKYKGTMPNNTSITIKDGTLGIVGAAFENCKGLASITIPYGVRSIGQEAFYGCSGLISVTIPSSVKFIGGRAFYGCSGLTSITIPNSITSIGDYAFYNCSGLTSVTILNSVTSIGDYAFNGCSGLTSIVSLNNTPPTCEIFLGNNTQFNSVDKSNCIVWVPRGSANAYKEADGWKDFNNIRELAYGDVNIDFEVNQADLDATTNFIVGKDPESFYESLANLNGDDKVDAADVVKLVTILNIQEVLSMDWQANYSNQVISSLSCTLNNDGDKAIQLTKCELYFNDKLVSSSKFKVTLSTGGSKKCSFDDLASLSSKTGFSLVWYYTYNGEDYTYRYDLTE